jgi:hypothetical protein
MTETHLPAMSKKIVRALIEVIKPRKPGFDLPLEDEMITFLDQFYAFFPFHMKLGFPMGLLLLEYGTFIFALKLRPFSKLSMTERKKYVEGWMNSRLGLRRDLIKGVKGVCLTAFYSQPAVMEHIGYGVKEHMARVALGEACDAEATAYFRGRGYDKNSRIPWPAFDHVDVICHDTPDPECRG